MPRPISGAVNPLCLGWEEGPPARLTPSLLASSHLGQLFTSTAPSLGPFLVKIKNLGVKNAQSQPLLPPSMEKTGLDQMWPPSHQSNPGLNPQLVVNKSAKVSKAESKAQRNNLIKLRGGETKRKRKAKEVSPRTEASQWPRSSIRPRAFKFDLD